MNAASSPQALFSAAELAFGQGRLDEARKLLVALERLIAGHPAVFLLRALVEHELGELEEAKRLFENAMRLAPGDPQIRNNFGNLLSDLGDEQGALDAYEQALRLHPGFAEAALNRAAALLKLGRRNQARLALQALAQSEAANVRLWNTLAAVEYEDGNLAAAAAAYDRALRLEPGHPLALRGRARIALQRGEADVSSRFVAARKALPDDPQLLLEETQVRLAEGDSAALEDMGRTLRRHPDWAEGRIALARMLWEAGRREAFDVAVEALAGDAPRYPALWSGLIQLLGECRQHEKAADAARAARDSLGETPLLALTEAIHASRAGDQNRALALYRLLPEDLPGRAANEAACRVRNGELERALALIDAALAENDSDMGAWGLAELVYRAAGDKRTAWLSGQAGLVSARDMPIDAAGLDGVRDLLRRLHLNSSEIAGQSVRNGTQTRGRLFDRTEPELAPLREALELCIAAYVERLPPADPRHPLLRHRAAPLRMAGSWSVRLTGTGHHASHFHPEGLISSACYFIVPDSGDHPGQGWLEIGRPPADLPLDIGPIATIAPRPGMLVLFPSFLHHGTTTFSSGERLTVAFDVELAR